MPEVGKVSLLLLRALRADTRAAPNNYCRVSLKRSRTLLHNAAFLFHCGARQRDMQQGDPSMSSDSSYITDSSSTTDSEREEAILTAVKEIVDSNRFDFLSKIGSGTYGDVHKVRDRKRNAELALKIVPSEDISEDETTHWARLQHSNIVPLYETIEYPSARVYLMPIVKSSLYDIIFDSYFCDLPGSWKQLKQWLHQILCGLEYMHGCQFCHLDVKADNVLVNDGKRAMLCDFSCIRSTDHTIKKGDFGLPSIYRPPEARPCLKELRVDGIAFDLWSFGIMALELFTDATISEKVDTCNVRSSDDPDAASSDLWCRDMYPVLMRITREKRFKAAVRKLYIKERLGPAECRRALDFTMAFLQPAPGQRWSAGRGKEHLFLGSGRLRLGRPPHEVWSKGIRKSYQYYYKEAPII